MNPQISIMDHPETMPPPGLIKPIPNGVFSAKRIGKSLSKSLRSNITGSFKVSIFKKAV